MLATLLFATTLTAAADSTAALPDDLKPHTCEQCADWNAPHAPFKLHGRSWFVGVEGLSVVLIDSGDGLVLLDGGLTQSVERVQANLKTLGFRLEDVKYIGISHPHFDHVGGVAALQRLSGATVIATADGAKALRSGDALHDDAQFRANGTFMHYPPVKGEVRIAKDGETRTLGDLTMTLHATSGHAPGGSTWTWRSCEDQDCVDIVYGDSLNPVSRDDFHFSDSPAHVKAMRDSIALFRSLPCDLLVSAHPSQSGLFEREAAGKLIGRDQCKAYADAAEKRLDQRLVDEQKPAD